MSSKDFPTIPSSNRKGQSAKVQCYIPIEMAREMAIIFDSHKFPFAEKTDMTRLALYNLIAWLDKMDHVRGSNVAMAQSMMDFLGREQEKAQYEEVILNVRKVVGNYERAGKTEDSRRVLAKVAEAVAGMEDGELMREYQEVLQSFSHLLPLSPNIGVNGSTPALSAFDPEGMTEEVRD